MKALEFTRLITEDERKEDVLSLKQELVDKINSLPDDEKTAKLIDEIEAMLGDIKVGGRLEAVVSRLQTIEDTDLKKEINKIAKIVATINMGAKRREKLFADWGAGKLVNVDSLTKVGTHTFSQVFPGYGTDDVMTELVNDLMKISGYGIGEGEVCLSALSTSIVGQGATVGKGDLIIDGKNVEVKTRGSNPARMKDREVTISPSYAKDAKTFMSKYAVTIKELQDKDPNFTPSASGLNLGQLSTLLQFANNQEMNLDVENILKELFPAINFHGKIVQNMISNPSMALQLYAVANVENYLQIKRSGGSLDGILFIDRKKANFDYIQSSSQLKGTGRRLHQSSAYPIAIKDPAQDPYPQILVQPGQN